MPTIGNSKIVKADDVLIAIAHYLPPDKRCFKAGREGSEYENPPRQPIHSFFYEYKPRFPVLRSIGFRMNALEPFSQEIGDAISNLFACGMIVVASNLPWHYHFSSGCDDSFEALVSKRLTPNDESQLKELTTFFQDRVAVPVQFEC